MYVSVEEHLYFLYIYIKKKPIGEYLCIFIEIKILYISLKWFWMVTLSAMIWLRNT